MKQRLGVCVLVLLCMSIVSQAQAPTAVVNGQVRDASGAAIVGATVEVFNDATHVRYSTVTNDEGIYSVPSLPPGAYHIQVSKPGFKTVIHPDITLNVQDAKAIGFTLPVGPISETVTVEGGAPLINTESAAVSTVVDRNFAENLPMNGRSFQTLIQLTPGVVLTANNGTDLGQFSINGQRAASNYWMVDGVSANIGMPAVANPSDGFAGTLGSFSAVGGTNSLVSVDALQEFRIESSTFAPEFGRTPGAQISIATRSGTNQFHGTAFDYLRNDVLDANDWFADSRGLPKPKERQNDFGGTVSGPLLRDKAFFFFSYEGLRLRLPQTLLTNVPDLPARQAAVSSIQPWLNAFPVPNGPDNLTTGIAQFNATFSNPAALDAYSLRIDHKVTKKLSFFGRYNYSPSNLDQRGISNTALSNVNRSKVTTQTGTGGLTWTLSSVVVNDFRFNYSRTDSSNLTFQDTFGGGVQVTTLPFPAGFSQANARATIQIVSLGSGGNTIGIGNGAQNAQKQINVVDSVSAQKGSHGLKFGVDFRRLSPHAQNFEYGQTGRFTTVAQADTGITQRVTLFTRNGATLLFRNLGIFAQDTWRASSRLTLTYGLRWDVDFAPSSIGGPSFPAASAFDLGNLSTIALAAPGTAPFETRYGNVAPRIGLAYQLSQNANRQTVFRGGFGMFYDLATTEAGNILVLSSFPFGAQQIVNRAAFPLTGAAGAPPVVTAPAPGTGSIFAFDPKLKLPYTLQWNVSLDQALGAQQTISATYIGAAGRRLLQTGVVFAPNPNFAQAEFVTNAGNSSYNALQLQFQRRLSHGLQALASYVWSHSIDTASASSVGSFANLLVPLNSNANRGPSDFDIRHAFSAGVTYEIPAPQINPFAHAILRGWSLQSVIQARSAPPVDTSDANFFEFIGGTVADIRPDLVPGQPFYLFGTQYPGGKAFNPAAFTDPPAASIGSNCPFGGCPARQGTTPRNFLRGFGATQWDFAFQRDFPIRESLKLQFRAEMFNVLNHPNFGQPSGSWPFGFGTSTRMLGQSLAGSFGVGAGAFSSLYQLGGPRSIQFGLKLQF